MRLRRGFAWTLAGNVSYSISQWLILVVFAKLLDARAVGQFAIALAIASPVFAFASFRLRAVQATDIRNEHEFPIYLGFRLLSSTAALAVSVISGMFAYGLSETTLVIAVVSVAKLIESISDIFYGLMQRHEAHDRIARSMMWKSGLSLAAVATMCVIWRDVVSGCLGLLAGWLILLFANDVRSARKLLTERPDRPFSFRPEFALGPLRSLFAISFPIGIVLAMNALSQSAPRYAIAWWYDEEMVGYFAAVAYVIVAGTTVANALGQVALPRLSKLILSDKIAYQRIILRMTGATIALAISGVAIAAVFGKTLLMFLYAPEYGKYSHVLVAVMICGIPLYTGTVFGAAITATRRFLSQAIIATTASFLSLIACYSLVPKYGLVGAAAGIGIGFGFKAVLQAYQVYALVKGRTFFGLREGTSYGSLSKQFDATR